MNRIANVLTGFSLAILFFAASAHAQSSGSMTANIPFEFSVGGVSFAPGQYEFLRAGTYLFQVRDADGRSRMTPASAPIQENKRPEQSRLTFATVDGRHVLIQIWSGRTASGNEFTHGQTSVKLAKSLTDNGTVAGSH